MRLYFELVLVLGPPAFVLVLVLGLHVLILVLALAPLVLLVLVPDDIVLATRSHSCAKRYLTTL